MTTAYTSLLGLALPVQGELQGTWGDTVNTQITQLLDSAVAGTTTLSTDADVTLTTTTGAANQARQAIILWTATGTTTRNITAPAQSKIYTVINKTGGTQSIVIRGVGPTTGVTIPAGTSAQVAWNGTDFVDVTGYINGNFTVNGNLVVNGTTTLKGNTSVGDSTADTLTVTSTITSNLLFTDNTYDIGASGATRPRNLYLAGNEVVAGTVTWSGGTTYGIPYLNASKVATTQSTFGFNTTALYFGRTPSDWTGLSGNVLQGQYWAIATIGANSTGYMQNAESDGSGGYKRTGAYPAVLYTQNNGQHEFSYAATGTANSAITWSRLVTINSTGLGVLTDSPPTALAVASNNPTRGALVQIRNTAQSSQSGAFAWFVQDNQQDWMIGAVPNSTSFGLYSARTLSSDGTQVWVIGSGGSTTNYSTDTNAQFNFSGATRSNIVLKGRYTAGGTDIGNISFANAVDGNVANIYAYTYNGNSATASGDLLFRVSVGGTLTQSVILSASNLAIGVGGANPQAWSGFTGPMQFPNGAHIVAAGGNFMQVGANCYYDGTNYKRVESGYASRYVQSAASHIWESADSSSAGSTISWGPILEGSPKYLRFNTSTNNMGSSVGVFTVNGILTLSGNGVPSGNIGGSIGFSGNTGSPVAGRVYFGDNTGWQWEWGYFNAGGWGRRFYFTDQGNAYNTNGTWGTISDAALKENIVDATPKLNELMQLRVRNFNFISDPDVKQLGFIAQEVEQIFPRLVESSRADENGDSAKVIKTTVLIPMLVKALQEQQALIDALTARLDAANI